MRIAVSADDARGLDAAVSPHFGRCPYYVLVDVDEGRISSTRVVANPFYGQHRPGQVPAFIQSQGADVMLTGGMGARAMSFFEECGIEAVTGAAGSVRHALEDYLAGRLRGAAACGESVEHGHGGADVHGGYEQDEIGRLREEAESLQRQLDEVMRRLGGLQGE
ncbi:MAG: NifB/NifX family molybdenum-iron cluster-binding protein [Anaerolineae bacterium]|nr:NifB/NifX family molybdenum-iron cluster-binding protein [Anaerolineae bacterium]